MKESMAHIEYDPASEDSIKRAINQLKSRLGTLVVGRGGVSAAGRQAAVKAACFGILDTDITEVYGLDSAVDRKEFYVYVHCDPMRKVTPRSGQEEFLHDLGVDYLPFYVGKGIRERCNDLDRNDTHRKMRAKLLTLGKDIHVQKVRSNLTERQALALESKLIDILGLRVHGGILVNLDEGMSPTERRKLYQDKLVTVNKFYRELLVPNEKLERRLRKVASV